MRRRRGITRRRFAKGALVGFAALLLLAGLAYGGVCVWFAAHSRSFIFYAVPRISASPLDSGLAGVDEVTIRTEDGERLYAWWKPSSPTHGVVLVLCGKGVIVSDEAGLFGDLAAQGFGVLALEYRGNGVSTGIPTEAGLRADARAGFDFARAAAPQAKVAVLGESLGTGIAVGLARDRPVAGVLLNSPYASVRGLYELRGPPLPYWLIMPDQLDSEALIGKIGAPVMILHGTEDDAIPISEARRLYAAAREPKTLIELEGVGHVAVWFGPTRERALAALAAWTAPDAKATIGPSAR